MKTRSICWAVETPSDVTAIFCVGKVWAKLIEIDYHKQAEISYTLFGRRYISSVSKAQVSQVLYRILMYFKIYI